MAKKKNVILIVVAAILVIAMAAAYALYGPHASAGGKNITVKVVHLDGETKDFSYSSDEEYLGTILTEEGLIEGEQSQYGLFVTTVDGETADDSKQQWWGYTVNGEDAVNGVDTQPVEDGDAYEFRLNEGY